MPKRRKVRSLEGCHRVRSVEQMQKAEQPLPLPKCMQAREVQVQQERTIEYHQARS